MTTKRRRRFTADFKKRVALEALRGDRTVQAIAAKHEVHPNQVGTWKRQAVEGLDDVFARGGSPGPSEHEATIRDLHAKIGELTMDEHQAPMRADEHQPLIGVLRAAGRERGEPGVDATDGRLVAPVPVLRQSADGAPPAARGRGGGAPSSPAPDGPDGPGGDLPQAAHERRAAGSPRLPVPAARTEDRPPFDEPPGLPFDEPYGLPFDEPHALEPDVNQTKNSKGQEPPKRSGWEAQPPEQNIENQDATTPNGPAEPVNHAQSEIPHPTDHELAIYRTLQSVNDNANGTVGDQTLTGIARKVLKTVHNNLAIDWTKRESIRAKLRISVRRVLQANGYPQDKHESATDKVLEQAETLYSGWRPQSQRR